MTISKRLLILMLVAVAALILTAGLNLVQMERIYKAANFSNENIVPSILILDRASSEFGLIRVRVYRHVLTTDAAAKSELEDKIKAAREATAAALKDYASTIFDAEDQQLYDKDKAAYAAYATGLDGILDLSRQNQHDEALAALTQGIAAASAVSTALEQHMKFKAEHGTQAAADGAAMKHSALWLSAVIGLVTVLVVGGLGFQIRGSLTARLAEANRLAERIAAGDLSGDASVNAATQDEVGQLMASMQKMRRDLADTVGRIIASTDTLLASASQLSTASQQVSASAESQSGSTASAAAAVEELTVSIDHVGHGADDARGYAQRAGTLAASSGQGVEAAAREMGQVAERVEHTAQQMQQLSDQVLKIGNITTVIREVADQTNLLALNAAIEAARAGEQGRGFAVVADEVRKLAERTTSSVQEISTVISTIQQGAEAAVGSMQATRGVVGAVVSAAESASSSMQDIRHATETVETAISGISDALREQQGASTALAQNVESIAQMSDENSAAVASVASTAQQLVSLADSLKNSVSRFRI